ncbi:MAG: ParB/RepB/Spo0J family partition protein [Zetaproteobacteria bacterium]|nr:MAG: ParB/RepB/Spo0J family partition protein [Zetaproteobacteria bacterium]
MKQKRRLGRGLDALLGEAAGAREGMRMIPIGLIDPNPYQPREIFDEAEIEKLAASIRQDGVLSPVLVRPHGGRYQLVAGERRWRAAQRAGLAEIPAVVREVSDAQALQLAIVENLQRRDLSPIEAAKAYQRLADEFGLTHEEIARRVGVSRAQITNTLRLLQLPAPVQAMVERGELSAGQARALVGLDEEVAVEAATRAAREQWSARKIEAFARRQKKKTRASLRDPDIVALEERLSYALGLPVRIRQRQSGEGELVIRYRRPEELDPLLEKLV